MRKKVTLAYITNDQERKASYKKGKKGFLKKLDELCTLCDVEASCIFYSAYEIVPVVWPNPEAAHAVLEWFKTTSPLERIKKTLDQESYNTMRIKKIHDQWYKVHKENRRKELELYMFQVIAGKKNMDCFDIRYATDMNWVINEVLKDVEAQINKLKRQTSEGTSNIAGGRAFEDGGFPFLAIKLRRRTIHFLVLMLFIMKVVTAKMKAMTMTKSSPMHLLMMANEDDDNEDGDDDGLGN